MQKGEEKHQRRIQHFQVAHCHSDSIDHGHGYFSSLGQTAFDAEQTLKAYFPVLGSVDAAHVPTPHEISVHNLGVVTGIDASYVGSVIGHGDKGLTRASEPQQSQH